MIATRPHLSWILPGAAFAAFAAGAGADKNPESAEVNTEIERLAQVYEIPAELVKAIAQIESNWSQWRPDGSVVKNAKSGATGMMQLTGGTKSRFDATRLETDWKYNLEAGVQVLDGKWGFVKALNIEKPGFPDRDRRFLENWYYPLNFYGGDLSGRYAELIYDRLEKRTGLLAKHLPAAVVVTRPGTALPAFKFRDWFVAVKDGLIGPDKALVKCETHAGTIPSMASLAQEEQIRTLFAEAQKTFAAGDVTGTVKRLRQVLRLDVRDQDKQPAKDLMAKIEEAAKGRLAEAEALEASQKFAEAMQAYDAVADAYGGLDAAKAAARKMTELSRNPEAQKARESKRRREEAEGLLARAGKYEESGEAYGAWSIYRMLAETYKDTGLAEAAAPLIAAIEADPVRMAAIRRKEEEEECRHWMTLAKNYHRARIFGKALEFYRRLIEKHPDAPPAVEARKAVKEIEEYLEANGR